MEGTSQTRSAMRRTEQISKILIYIFKPEDTTELGTISSGGVYDPADLSCSWLGPLKATVWLAIAVAGPISTFVLLLWIS
jgi:hypothetical protein